MFQKMSHILVLSCHASTMPWCIVGTAEYQLAMPEANHSVGLSGPLYPGVQTTDEPDMALAKTLTERP